MLDFTKDEHPQKTKTKPSHMIPHIHSQPITLSFKNYVAINITPFETTFMAFFDATHSQTLFSTSFGNPVVTKWKFGVLESVKSTSAESANDTKSKKTKSSNIKQFEDHNNGINERATVIF